MSIFPKALNFNKKVEPPKELPICTEYAYDFEKNELALKDGRQYYVYENEALKVWIFKAIVSERYRYDAYSNDYGCEITKVIGTTLSTAAKKAEIKRYIIEALMVNPYIKAILDIRMDIKREKLYVEVDVRSIYNSEVVKVKCKMPIA